jgi:dihydroorotate dehydrogenase electron transfer subunit
VATVLSNQRLTQDFYLMETDRRSADSNAAIRAGQFCMLRSWGNVPVLSRPVSVFDADEGRVSFLYKTVGQGTALFSRLRPGDSITVQGPLGKGFPMGLGPAVAGRIAMVGGGAGIAPFYLGAKQCRAAGCAVDLFLGFSGEPFLEAEYHAVANSVTVKRGGFITDEVDPSRYDRIFSCGPEPMMWALWEKCRAVGTGDRLFVSLESRMACGVGACYGCSRKTVSDGKGVSIVGNKKVCKDGPVFPAAEVFAP